MRSAIALRRDCETQLRVTGVRELRRRLQESNRTYFPLHRSGAQKRRPIF